MKKKKAKLTVSQLAAEIARRQEAAAAAVAKQAEDFDYTANLALGPDHPDYVDMPLPRGLGLYLDEWEGELQ
jgi:hypothetical protein